MNRNDGSREPKRRVCSRARSRWSDGRRGIAGAEREEPERLLGACQRRGQVQAQRDRPRLLGMPDACLGVSEVRGDERRRGQRDRVQEAADGVLAEPDRLVREPHGLAERAAAQVQARRDRERERERDDGSPLAAGVDEPHEQPLGVLVVLHPQVDERRDREDLVARAGRVERPQRRVAAPQQRSRAGVLAQGRQRRGVQHGRHELGFRRREGERALGQRREALHRPVGHERHPGLRQQARGARAVVRNHPLRLGFEERERGHRAPALLDRHAAQQLHVGPKRRLARVGEHRVEQRRRPRRAAGRDRHRRRRDRAPDRARRDRG